MRDRFGDPGGPPAVGREDVVGEHELPPSEAVKQPYFFGAALRRLLPIAERHRHLRRTEIALEHAAAGKLRDRARRPLDEDAADAVAILPRVVQVPGRHREIVEIVNGRAIARVDDLAVAAAYVHTRNGCGRGSVAQLAERQVALAGERDVDHGLLQALHRHRRNVRTASRDQDVEGDVLAEDGDVSRLVHQRRGGGDADDVGFPLEDPLPDQPPVVGTVAQVENFDLVTAAQGLARNRREPERGIDRIADRTFGGAVGSGGIGRIDQQDAGHRGSKVQPMPPYRLPRQP